VDCDLLEAAKEGKIVIEMLRRERQDALVWDELYQTALDLAEPLEIAENMPRRFGRQTGRANHPADTPKQYWRISLYYPFLDHMIMELESRLLKSKDRFSAQHLLPRFVENITNDQVATIYNSYQADLALCLEDFRREVTRWRTRWEITHQDQKPSTLPSSIHRYILFYASY
jgi:hypothetical protein